MLIYQDDACTVTMELSSGGTLNSPTGSIYVPAAQVHLSSSGNMTINGQLIADTVQVSSSGTISINYSAANTALGIIPTLIE